MRERRVKDDFSGLGLSSWKDGFAVIQRWIQKLSFRDIKFEISIRHLSRK